MDPLPGSQPRHLWKKDMDAAFENGTIGSATPEDLQRWSAMLSSTHKDINLNFGDDASRIIRSLAISNTQTALMIRDIEATNKKTQQLVIVLAVVAVIVGIIQVVVEIIGWCI